MPKKLTYNFVKESFEKEGCTLLSKEYKNAKTKLNYICPKGHKHSITWNGWNRGNRCSYCANKNKLSIDVITANFINEGYTLLSKDYVDNKNDLYCRCANEHNYYTTWNKWQRGNRCPYCYGNVKHDYAYIKNKFKEEGYTLISKRYKNAKTKLNYICSKGHCHFITWSDWKGGHRCPYCSKVAKLDIEYVRHAFSETGYTLLSSEYINNSTKLKYKCSSGHINYTSFAAWTMGKRCPTCYKLSMFGPGNPSWKGGKSFEPYCEIWKDKEYKQSIRDRDGNRCLNPYCDSKNPKDLTIHHINYDKKNCKPSNLITICRSCNSKANTNRSWHRAWYQAILKKKGESNI